MKTECIMKALQPSRFPHGNYARLIRMYWSDGLIGPLVFACPCSQIWALAVPRQTRVTAYLVCRARKQFFKPPLDRWRVKSRLMSRKRSIFASETGRIYTRSPPTLDLPNVESFDVA